MTNFTKYYKSSGKFEFSINPICGFRAIYNIAKHYFVNSHAEADVGIVFMADDDVKTWFSVINEIHMEGDELFTWITDDRNNHLEHLYEEYNRITRKSYLMQTKNNIVPEFIDEMEEVKFDNGSPNSWTNEFFEQRNDCYLTNEKRHG